MGRYYYQIEVKHSGLNLYRVVKDADKRVCQMKADALMASWDERWNRQQERERKKIAREQEMHDKKTASAERARLLEEKKQLAIDRTEEAMAEIEAVRNVLKHTLTINDAVDWDSLKDHRKFQNENAKFPKPKPNEPKKMALPVEPKETDQEFQIKLGFFDKLNSKKREEKEASAKDRYAQAHLNWESTKAQAVNENDNNLKSYESKLKAWQNEEKKWKEDLEKQKQAYLARQEENNAAIDEKKKDYEECNVEAISSYCDLVLTNSQYPDYFPQEWELEYNPENQILIVDYKLPDIVAMPRLKEVKYVQSRDDFKETELNDKAIASMYDDLLYQIALRTMHELFEADTANALSAIVFNGCVDHVDKATGQAITNACVLSIQTQKDEFLAINLNQIEGKACFKKLKGVGSSKLHSMTPVAPLLVMNKEDKRFISAYGVADDLDESMNLAAMDWQDFENLIRELFEKEFSVNGGEVKITRASRDGGVDAVAFDPDPIRGGKIVIQAKRYTNTVGVAAVRDLYGTVVNEGAIKGILVSTADYGPDAYDFAKDKPLTLLSGGNLLHLLDKHGHKARIDLKEAKILLAEQEK